MSVNGREIEGLLASAQEQLDLYRTANIGELLSTTLSSVDESTRTINMAFSRLDRIKEQLKEKQEQQKNQITELNEIQQEFETRREDQYQKDSERLQQLIDSPARAELLHTREMIAKINVDFAGIQNQQLHEMLTTQEYKNILKLQVYQSLGISLEKVRTLSTDKVWELLETLWGESNT